jgi:selenocysteine lyase/cysteine desulfurase
MTPRPDAGRYECGTLNTVGCYGLRAAIEFLIDVGIDRIQGQVLALVDQIERGVRGKGYEVMIPRDVETGSGIISFRHNTIDARAIVSELKRHRILAAPRQGWVRAAPHFYIAPSEIDRMLDIIPE